MTILVVACCVVWVFSSFGALAQSATYRFFSDEYQYPGSPLAYGMSVRGHFTTTTPLAAGQEMAYVSTVEDYEIDTGLDTFTPDNSVLVEYPSGPNPRVLPFFAATDSKGMPTAPHYIAAVSPKPPHQLGDVVSFVFSYSYSGDSVWVATEMLCIGTEPWGDSQICTQVPYWQVAAEPLALTWSMDTTDEVASCDSLSGKLKGVCTAYCEAINCDANPENPSCPVLAKNFVKFGGGSTIPPC